MNTGILSLADYFGTPCGRSVSGDFSCQRSDDGIHFATNQRAAQLPIAESRVRDRRRF